ncbi:MAG TPA: LptF/LptG family permease, partial [Gemmatimonadales bacterium]|nr:LptF/LptG family permease [Gemmatimonadales bacterium]
RGRLRPDRVDRAAGPRPTPPDSALLARRAALIRQDTPLLSFTGEVQSAQARIDGAKIREAAYLVEAHKKWAISAACIVFVLVGVPIALRFPRGGLGVVIGAGLFIFMIADVGLIAGESLGRRGTLPPAVAIWSTKVLLAAAGLWGIAKVSRESGSTRGGDMAELLATVGAAIARPFRRRR